MSWQSFFFVFIGSGLGGFIRYLFAFLHGKIDEDGVRHFIPILVVNILGSFLIGIAYGLLEKNGLSDRMNLLLITGFLGGFTTYSSFSLDILKLLQGGQVILTILYLISTVILGLLAVYLGFWLTK